MCLYGFIRPGRIFYGVLPFVTCFASLRKGRSGVTLSTNLETMVLHDAGVVYFTEYLSVLFQLTYLNELYGECSVTACACVNSGYQALFSPITEPLGTRLITPLILMAQTALRITSSETMDGRWMREDFTNWKKSTSPSDFTRSSWAWMQKKVPVRPIPSLQGITKQHDEINHQYI